MNLSLVLSLFFLIAGIGFMGNSFAQESVTVSHTSFENTLILELTNNQKTPIKHVYVWLDDDSAFKSIKTEQNWIGRKNLDGVVIFHSKTQVIEQDRSIKFGFIVNALNYKIHWRVVDSQENILSQDVIGIPDGIVNTTIVEKKTQSSVIIGSIIQDSKFRLVPEKIYPGSVVRIIGTQFNSNKNVDFFLNDVAIGGAQSNKDGKFVGTIQLPVDQIPQRIKIYLRDDAGNSREMSIRVSEIESNEEIATTAIPFEITTVLDILHHRDPLVVNGTGPPRETISLSISDSQGTIYTTILEEIDSDGKWAHTSIVAPNILLGTSKIDVKLNNQTKSITFEVIGVSGIDLHAGKEQYEPGETLEFRGFSKIDDTLDVSLLDPSGKEIFYTTIDVKNNQNISLDIPTQLHYTKGTYILDIVLSNDEKYISVGIGTPPEELVDIKLDKTHYNFGEDVLLTINGPSFSNVVLLILDPSDVKKYSKEISLDNSGQSSLVLDLDKYSQGIYSALVTRGSIEFYVQFTVGLSVTGDIININKIPAIAPGKVVTIIGTLSKNTLIELEFIDPDDNIVFETVDFSDKNGHLSNSDFRLPINAKPGATWNVIASLGANKINLPINVLGHSSLNLTINTEKIISDSNFDLKIYGLGATSGSAGLALTFVITNSSGTVIDTLTSRSTTDGSYETFWQYPNNLLDGTYTIALTAGDKKASTTFIKSAN